MPRQPINTPIQQATTATPAWPPAGALKLYPKADGNFYKLDSAGVEAALGTGGGDGSGGVVHEEFLPAASATTITLGYPAQVVIMVAREGVVQSATDGNYSLSGVIITFTDAFDGTERVVVDYSASSFVPPVVPPVNGSDLVNNTVTSAKIADGTIATIDLANAAVTNAKLASDTARANLLTNNGFEVWQRGNGPFTATGGAVICADRWFYQLRGTGAGTIARDTANADGVGVCAACSVTATSAVTATNVMTLMSMNVNEAGGGQQLRGKTVTVSWRVKANAAGCGIVPYAYNPTTLDVLGTATTVGTAYATVTHTFTFPDNTGTVYIGLFFTTVATYYVDNAMLVVGSQAADYAPVHPADDLMRCQRYYELIGVGSGAVGGDIICRGPGLTGAVYDTVIRFRVPKPVLPTVTKVGTWTVSGLGQPIATSVTVEGFRLEASVGAVQADAYTYNSAASMYLTVEANP